MTSNPRGKNPSSFSYIAFLRGINSGQNPVQRMDDLRRIFEQIGFQNVQTVITSGNVLFETDSPYKKALEERIEKALLEETGIETVAIIRTSEELQELVGRDPFGKVKLTPTMKPYATFLKNAAVPWKAPQKKRHAGAAFTHPAATGENRLMYLYLRPGQNEAVREYFELTWPNQFAFLDPVIAVNNGLFGPGKPHPRLRDRLGDLLVLARGNAYLWWGNKDDHLYGRHGGLSPDEMLVPFLAVRLG